MAVSSLANIRGFVEHLLEQVCKGFHVISESNKGMVIQSDPEF
jgi:hypothetical protein